MSADVLLLLRGLFSALWTLVNGWYLPGTNVTPAAFALAILFIWLILRWIVRIFGMQSSMKGGGDSE